MRTFALFTVALGLFAADIAPAQGKKGKDDKEEKKDASLIRDIGGRTLDEWIKDINHKDPGRRATAMSTVLLFGPDRAYQALPAILEQLNKHTLSAPLDVSVRVNGATALGLIIGSAKEPDPKHVKQAVTILERLCKDSQAIVKFRAVQALGRIGEDARGAINVVLPILRDTYTCEARQAAAITLGQIALDKVKGPPIKVLEELYKSLGDHSAQVRLAAIQSLTWLGAPGDAKAQNALVAALDPVAHKDPEPTVQIWAHMAVMSVTHDVSTARVGLICKMLGHAEVPIRMQAAQAIGTIGPKAKSCIPALMEALTDKDPGVIMVTIWALSRMEEDARRAVPALEKMSKDADMPEIIQLTAKEAIKHISGKKKEK